MITGPIECVLSDVDGVWTDNRLWFGGDAPLKVFDVRDGHGAVMLRKRGLPVAFVTGRNDLAMRQRAEELGVDWEFANRERPKGVIVRELLARYGVDAARTVFVGDDLTDLAAFAEVGWPVAVADAEVAVRRAARRVTRARGGHGAFREVVRWILRD
ncbi:MAG: HAD family hydrolase [Candidatus Dadabacteria bacterium]|nr:MAG: HAD family hydrolase [Candidatus Dadabacteria bacterium]